MHFGLDSEFNLFYIVMLPICSLIKFHTRLTMNEDILGTFRALHVGTEIINRDIAVKMVKTVFKSNPISTKCWSVILKVGQKII